MLETWLLHALFVSVVAAVAVGPPGPTVEALGAKILGRECASSRAQVFQGIPYAQPPTGSLRFMPPRPWNGSFDRAVLDATQPAPPCIQWHHGFAVKEPKPSEDCLYLDVYVPPDTAADASLPVKVFAYGGGNNAGAANHPLYNACDLATDAVVVVFNYRLGPLGFLSLAGAGIRGNMAIQDYLAALGWVRAHVAAFGGSPAKVVLFGQSAGAGDAFVVSTLPGIETLVSAAAVESGGGHDVTPFATAQVAGESYAQALGCNATDLSCLQSLSVADLKAARYKTPALLKNGKSLGAKFGISLPDRTNLNSAVLDGEIIKEEPLRVGSRVPIIVGSNEYESTLFVLPLYGHTVSSLSDDSYASFLKEWGTVEPLIRKQYPLSMFNDSSSVGDAVVAAITHITTLAGFTCPSYRAIRATVRSGTPTFVYRFNHTPSCPWLWVRGKTFPGRGVADNFRAAHSAELPFVFGSLSNQPFGNGTCNATSADYEISKSLVAAWTAIAAVGDPSTARLPWPRFDVNESRGLYVDSEITPSAPIDFTECEFWDGVWAQLGGVDFSNPTVASFSSREFSTDCGISD